MQQSKIRRYLKHGTLPQLTVFEAVTRLGSFTRAAEELSAAQPTVSVQIKKLTETVGTPLFEQVGKRVHLTDAGRCVYEACEGIFRTFRDMENSLMDIRGLKAGRLQIAASASGKYFATRMLADFARQYPAVEVALHVLHRPVLLERIASDVDDLYILSNPPHDRETVQQMIFPNPMLAYAHASHPLARQKNIPFERFAQEPFLMREPGAGTRLVTENAFAEHGMRPKVRMELGDDEAILHAVSAGLGVSILSRYAANPDDQHKQVVALDVEGFPLPRHWYFVYPVGKRLPLIAQTFMDFARGALGNYERKKDVTKHSVQPTTRSGLSD